MDRKRTSGLSDKENNALQRHWKTLKQDVRMSEIVDTLIEEGILKPTEWEEMKRSNNSEKDKTEDFLHKLQRRTSKDFIIFVEALKKNGFEHIACKLEIKPKRDETARNTDLPSTSAGQDLNTAKVMDMIKNLHANNEQHRKDFTEYKREQELKTIELEKTLTKNLKKTNDELDKMREILKSKEHEIEKLKRKQTDQELLNKDLQEENKTLQIERETTLTELKMSKYKAEELELKIKKEKVGHTSVLKEKEKIEMRLERQTTRLQDRLQQEREERLEAEDRLKRESTDLETARKEKDCLAKEVKRLEAENETLTLYRSDSVMSDASISSEILYSRSHHRRPPSGLSERDRNELHGSMARLEEEMQDIEEKLKVKQVEQRNLEKILKRLKANKSSVSNSQVCVLQ